MDTDALKTIAERADPNYTAVRAALEIVADYVQRKDFVLYGGQAIHYALRAAGHAGIYTDDVLPDYDFICTSWRDSVELADILNKTHDNVSAINALHLQTRRVRTNFIVVGDLAVLPENVLAMIPRLRVNMERDFSIVHPHWQILDMHRALCTPYENAPREVIFHRAQKDVQRMQLLEQYYPITVDKKIIADTRSASTRKFKIAVQRDAVPLAISGIAAYAIYYEIINRLLYTLRAHIAPEIVQRCEEILHVIVKTEFAWNGKVAVPQNLPVVHTVITPDPHTYAPDAPKYFHRLLDDLRAPQIAGLVDGIEHEIQDSHTRLVPAMHMSILLQHLRELDVHVDCDLDVHVASLQQVHLHMLVNTFLDTKRAPAWRYLYNSSRGLEKIAQCLALARAEVMELPVFPFHGVIGENNWGYAWLYNHWMAKARVYGTREQIQYVKNMRPPNYYGAGVDWQCSNDWIYSFTGLQCTPEEFAAETLTPPNMHADDIV